MLYLAVVMGRVLSSSGEREFLMRWAMKNKQFCQEEKKSITFRKNEL